MSLRTLARAPLVGALLLFWAGTGALAANTQRVTAVIDGDTLVLASGVHLRLIGINTPELAHGTGPDEPLADAARERLAQLVLDQRVRIEPGVESRDRYGRLLASVFLDDGSDVQAALLEAGLAQVIAVPPNIEHLQRYREAEAGARKAGRGIWGHPWFAAVPATALAANTSGFHRVTGTVRRVGKSRKYVYLDLAPGFNIMVTHTDWRRWFHGHPEAWRGRRVEVRGWITRYNSALHMRVHHPAMIETLR
jgi:endonuclease YncB( thermonuclease family)